MRKMKELKVETVTLIGEGRKNLTCCVFKCMKLIIKYFFLGDLRLFFLVGGEEEVGMGGVILVLDTYVFIWWTHFVLGVDLD